MNDRSNKVEIIGESILLALRVRFSGSGLPFLAVSSTLLALCFIFSWILFPDNANSGPYLSSAHGNSGSTGYGVNRTSISAFGYSKGNCAHCHEQHASIGGTEPAPVDGAPSKYALFKPLFSDQTIGFCYSCHKDITTSVQVSIPNQYIYSRMSGGDTTITCPDDIKEAFQFVNDAGIPQSNCSSSKGSSHLLKNIDTFLTGKWGYDKFSICSGCHNPHGAQKDPHTSTGRIVSGELVSSVSRPSQHADLTTWGIWGDDSTERMNISASNNYQSPKRVGGGYEPDGSLTQDGSNMVDFVTFCTDCHNSTNTIYSSILGRNLYKVNWGAAGDFHGGRARIDSGDDFFPKGEFGDLLEPYKSGGRLNYILSCTDCHEPHGAPNEFLMRQTLNGTQVNAFSSSGQWYYWCQTCHSVNLPFTPSQHLPPVDATTNCFNAGACHRHCDGAACSSNNLF